MLTKILNQDDIKYLIDLLNSDQTLIDIFETFCKTFYFQKIQYCEILYFMLKNNLLRKNQNIIGIFIIYNLSLDNDYSFVINFLLEILNKNNYADILDEIINDKEIYYEKIDCIKIRNKKVDVERIIKNIKKKYTDIDFNLLNNNIQQFYIDGFNNESNVIDNFFDIEYINEIIRLIPECYLKKLDLSFLRPLPDEVPLFDEEIQYITPLTFDYPLMLNDFNEKKLFNQIISKASVQILNNQENKLLTQIICFNINYLNQEIMKKYLPGMVEYNNYLVSRILFKLVNLDQVLFKSTLTMFIQDIKMSIHSLEIIFNLLQGVYLPQEFLDCYIYEWFRYCSSLNKDQKQQTRKLKLITKFVSHLVEKKLFDPAVCFEVWIKFCTEFEVHKCAKELHKILKSGFSNNN